MKMKKRSVFVCTQCGNESIGWQGHCPACGAWNSMVEQPREEEKPHARRQRGPAAKAQPITAVEGRAEERFATGIDELDGVLGGGIVPGALLLLGGEPGIGKSTILMQAAKAICQRFGPVLYISGEESARQIRMRAERLSALADDLYLLAETDISRILSALSEREYRFVILDSIQSVYSDELSSAPGSVAQVRHCTALLLEHAKRENVATALVGHVTKEGALAGPRVLEHMVDTVLYFEGDRHSAFRLLRAVKNRFGSTNEIGVFEMAEEGLLSLADPSRLFLAQRPEGASGSVVSCSMQGTRPVLLEVQALLSHTVFGNPRRLAAGLDYNRLLIIVSVLEKRLGLRLGAQDIYVNVAGGLRTDDPALDLAVAAAIVSCLRDIPVAADTVVFGELGLAGEVRSVSNAGRRLRECEKFGFARVLQPAAGAADGGARVKDLQSAMAELGLL